MGLAAATQRATAANTIVNRFITIPPGEKGGFKGFAYFKTGTTVGNCDGEVKSGLGWPAGPRYEPHWKPPGGIPPPPPTWSSRLPTGGSSQFPPPRGSQREHAGAKSRPVRHTPAPRSHRPRRRTPTARPISPKRASGGRQLLGLRDYVLDSPLHIERLLGELIELTRHDPLERRDRVLELHVLPLESGELRGDKERLGEEALDPARARDQQFVLFR